MEQVPRSSETRPAEPGTVRPGGRTAKVRRVVPEATEDALVNAGSTP
jgi:hypothetical protein